MKIKAFIFDVDGTLANTEKYGHLKAFNKSFKHFGLNWYWSNTLYKELLTITGGKERIKYYLQKYQKDFSHSNLDKLISDIHMNKNINYANLVKGGKIQLRTGIKRLLNEAYQKNIRLAIATTTTLSNVTVLLNSIDKTLIHKFEIIGAGDMVANKKPAGDIYQFVLDKMSLKSCECLAFEDSENGLLAANSCGLKTIITINEYTKDHNFTNALLVVDNLGEENKKCTFLSGKIMQRYFVDVDFLLNL